MRADSQREIVYVGDPMCSWCWGIAPELDELQRRLPELQFRIVVGGLRPGPYARALDDNFAGFLAHHWQEVNARTGQPFDQAILKRRGWTYDTEPPCRAVVAMRGLDEDRAWPLFRRLQQAFYTEGVVLTDPSVYPGLVEEVGADAGPFMDAFQSREVIAATWMDFLTAKEWGIRGFPTLIATDGERGTIIANGYTSANDMERAITASLR